VRSRLAEGQEEQGIEGVIVAAESKDGRLSFDVKLENVPGPYRVAAEDCKLIAG